MKKVLKLLKRYNEDLKDSGYDFKYCNKIDPTLPYSSNPHALDHVRWICKKSIELQDDLKSKDLARLLGFIQGVLWMARGHNFSEFFDETIFGDYDKGLSEESE